MTKSLLALIFTFGLMNALVSIAQAETRVLRFASESPRLDTKVVAAERFATLLKAKTKVNWK